MLQAYLVNCRLCKANNRMRTDSWYKKRSLLMETWIRTRQSLMWINVKLCLRLIRFSQRVQSWFNVSSCGEGLECTVSGFCRVAVRKGSVGLLKCVERHDNSSVSSFTPEKCGHLWVLGRLLLGTWNSGWGDGQNHAVVNAWSSPGILKLGRKWWQRDEKKVETLVEEERLLYCLPSIGRTTVHR